MKVNHSKSIRFAIAAALAVGTCQIAGAVGLGPISVNSHIGEPLQASIRVNGLSASDAANTRIKIADAAAYKSRGITKLPSHSSLRFGLAPAGNGYIITVRSNQQIREPFINFLLSMNSGGKEIIREYAVFLDPAAGSAIPTALTEPVMESEAPVPAVPGGKLLDIRPASSTSVGWQGKSAATPVKSAPSVAKSAPAAPASQVTWNGKTYGPVQPGETLYSIADKVRPSENYSIQSVMQQIFRANRSAFSSHSLSSLMAGYTLRIPEFRQGTVAMPTKPKRSKTYQPAPQRKATPPSPVADNAVSMDSAEGEQVQEQMQEQVQDSTPHPTPDSEGTTQPSLLNEQIQEAQEAVEKAAGEMESVAAEVTEMDDGIMTEPTSSDEEKVDTEETVNTEDTANEDTVNNDDVIPEMVMVDETAESVPPVDAQPTIIMTEENSVQESAPDVAAPEPVQAAVPANNEPATQPPVIDEEEDKGFLFTTYAILPMWQWLAISGAALVLIALLLFRQRRKSVEIDDEGDGLDADEMEAVLAKINAIDDDDYDDLSHTPTHDHNEFDDPVDDWDNDTDNDMFVQEPAVSAEHDSISLHKPDYSESHPDMEPADFLSDDDIQVDTEDDFDFLEEQNNISAEPDTKSGSGAAESAEADFFADDDIDWEELGVSATPEKDEVPVSAPKQTPIAKRDSSMPDDSDWLDDLVFEGEEPPARKIKPASTTPSNDEMEINLDLASSFIATGHGERAISWLEEVIEIGTAEQKARAEELLAKVRNA